LSGSGDNKDVLKKCHQCMEVIRIAKDRQAAEAAKNASSLLEELDREKNLEESKKAAAARKREKKKRKKLERQQKTGGGADSRFVRKKIGRIFMTNRI
jgi:ankyrin repeat domain-containing protein 17